jgi:hypothetical protein
MEANKLENRGEVQYKSEKARKKSGKYDGS